MAQFSVILLKLLSLAFFVTNSCNAAPSANYEEDRQKLILEEREEAYGGKLRLTGNEVLANECLMHHKRNEIDFGFENPTKFLPAQNFLKVRKNIELSKVFQIIRKAPKGGVFHAHSSAIVTADFIIRRLTYEPNLYICTDVEIQFKFILDPSVDTDCNNWRLLSDVRKDSNEHIDESIRGALALTYNHDSNINDVWMKFEKIFTTVKGLITYRPLFEKFFTAAMQELFDDNVMFMEIRTTVSTLYELNGTQYNQLETVQIYQEVTENFKNTHPGFFGTKIIYSPYRKLSESQFEEHVEVYKTLKDTYPDYVIGFDLVGQEDKGYALHNYVKKLVELSKEEKYANFFFHAGETNWYGLPSDENLYDAILLNTKRIGHGFALLKHPKLMEIAREKKIAIELNPISNQVLKLVEDMRNHPGSYFFAADMPVVVSSDDPGFWHASGLSYDFYEVFMGMMSRDADLRALKQLALNSITYSGFNIEEQEKILDSFNTEWSFFIADLIEDPLCTKIY